MQKNLMHYDFVKGSVIDFAGSTFQVQDNSPHLYSQNSPSKQDEPRTVHSTQGTLYSFVETENIRKNTTVSELANQLVLSCPSIFISIDQGTS